MSAPPMTRKPARFAAKEGDVMNPRLSETKEETQRPEGSTRPDPETLRVAYEVHSLAQVLYGHLAARHFWSGVGAGMCIEPVSAYPAVLAGAAWVDPMGIPMGYGPARPGMMGTMPLWQGPAFHL